MELLSKWNVAHHYEKRSLLVLVNAVAGLSIFFFGYDQGLMGGVVTNRNYAETMGFGYWDEATQEVKVTHSLLKGGIVRVHRRPAACNRSHFLDRCLLLAWNARRFTHGWMAWRPLRPDQGHRFCCAMGYCWSDLAMRSTRKQMDVLRYDSLSSQFFSSSV